MLFFLGCVATFSPAQALLLRGTDTDEASRERAKAYPAVCRLDFVEDGIAKQATGVLIKKAGEIGYVLTAKHCAWDDVRRSAFQVNIFFDKSDGTVFSTSSLACAIATTGPYGITSGGIEDDLAVITCKLPVSFDIAPMPLCTSTESVLTYDSQAGVSRGEGCLVGYGRHGINKKKATYGVDQFKRHAGTYFMEYKRIDRQEWSLFSWLSVIPSPFGHCVGASFADSFHLSQDVFLTRLKHDANKNLEYDSGDYWSAHPEFMPIDTPCIKERIHRLQGFVQKSDSGAPLIVQKDGQPHVLGIVSHIYTDDVVKFQNTRYTPVLYYQDWLAEQLGAETPSGTSSESSAGCASSSLSTPSFLSALATRKKCSSCGISRSRSVSRPLPPTPSSIEKRSASCGDASRSC